MALLRPIFLLCYIILVNNVTSYRSADSYENLTKESMCYVLEEPHLVTEEHANFSDELQNEEMSIIESSIEDTDTKCYAEPRNIELLKKILSSTCALDEEKEI